MPISTPTCTLEMGPIGLRLEYKGEGKGKESQFMTHLHWAWNGAWAFTVL